MRTTIPITVKKTCCQMKRDGMSNRQIYDEYFLKQFTIYEGSYNSFRHSITQWMKKKFADNDTLDAGTYDGFIAHDATVQVSKSGEIVQAWIKQKAGGLDPDEFIQAIRANIEPVTFESVERKESNRMLELPLFDMHWGVAFMDHYKPVLDELIELIQSRYWDKIVILFGQDFFHNDSIINGVTTKGTNIGKVDMIRAVKEGRDFIYKLVAAAISKCDDIVITYSPGNHDTSISWMFMQALTEMYRLTDEVTVDDTLEYRKVITYGKNAIMVTHGDSKQATAKNLAHIFPISFAKEFGDASIREVHAGHLHHESEADIYGVMVRRLSTGGKVDEWSNKQDFIGAHKRFMVFEWDRNKLASIHYI